MAKPIFGFGTANTYPYGSQYPVLGGQTLDAKGGRVGGQFNIGSTDVNVHTPRNMTWSVAVDRDFGRGLVANVAYVGSHTTDTLLGGGQQGGNTSAGTSTSSRVTKSSTPDRRTTSELHILRAKRASLKPPSHMSVRLVRMPRSHAGFNQTVRAFRSSPLGPLRLRFRVWRGSTLFEGAIEQHLRRAASSGGHVSSDLHHQRLFMTPHRLMTQTQGVARINQILQLTPRRCITAP